MGVAEFFLQSVIVYAKIEPRTLKEIKMATKTIANEYYRYEGEVDASDKPCGKGIKRKYDGDVCEGVFSGGYLNGHGRTAYANGNVFEGEYAGDIATGYGTLTLADGTVYAGEYDSGLMVGDFDADFTGTGKRVWSDGNIYEGYFVEKSLTGRGKKYAPNGVIFDFEFERGTPKSGTLIFPDGTRHRGSFEKYAFWEGDFSYPGVGKGIKVETSGTINEGEFVAGALVKGRRLNWNGTVFEGEFKSGRLCGHGRIIHADGGKIEGEFDNGFLNGYVKWTLADGSVYLEGDFEKSVLVNAYHIKSSVKIEGDGYIYEGEAENGVPSGEGKKTYTDPSLGLISEEGTFKNGALWGHARRLWSDHDIWEGEFENDNMNGRGRMTTHDGVIYEGNFVNDTLNGYGKIVYASSEIYEGDFVMGNRHGEGALTLASGVVLEGRWENDRLKELLRDTYDGEKNSMGQPHGEGVMYYADGTTYRGEWGYGAWYGKGVYTVGAVKYEGYFLGTRQSINLTRHENGKAEHGSMTRGKFEKL